MILTAPAAAERLRPVTGRRMLWLAGVYYLVGAVALIVATLVGCANPSVVRSPPSPSVDSAGPPLAQRIPTEQTVHGTILRDDFRWIQKRDSPEVLAYLQAENLYGASQLRHTQPAQEILAAELADRQGALDISAPRTVDEWLFSQRTPAGQQYPVVLRRRDVAGAAEEVVLDINLLAQGKPYLKLRGWWVSGDAQHPAPGLRHG